MPRFSVTDEFFFSRNCPNGKNGYLTWWDVPYFKYIAPHFCFNNNRCIFFFHPTVCPNSSIYKGVLNSDMVWDFRIAFIFVVYSSSDVILEFFMPVFLVVVVELSLCIYHRCVFLLGCLFWNFYASISRCRRYHKHLLYHNFRKKKP